MKKILTEVIEKKESALQEINNQYARLFYSICFDITKDSFYSEEVVNDCLLFIWNKAAFLNTLDHPESYLCTICYNKGIDYLRKAKKIVYNNDLAFSLRDNSENTNEMIDYLLSKLNEEQRQIVIMKLAYNMTYDDIAKTLKLSVKKVRLRLDKAKQKMDKIIKGEIK